MTSFAQDGTTRNAAVADKKPIGSIVFMLAMQKVIGRLKVKGLTPVQKLVAIRYTHEGRFGKHMCPALATVALDMGLGNPGNPRSGARMVRRYVGKLVENKCLVQRSSGKGGIGADGHGLGTVYDFADHLIAAAHGVIEEAEARRAARQARRKGEHVSTPKADNLSTEGGQFCVPRGTPGVRQSVSTILCRDPSVVRTADELTTEAMNETNDDEPRAEPQVELTTMRTSSPPAPPASTSVPSDPSTTAARSRALLDDFETKWRSTYGAPYARQKWDTAAATKVVTKIADDDVLRGKLKGYLGDKTDRFWKKHRHTFGIFAGQIDRVTDIDADARVSANRQRRYEEKQRKDREEWEATKAKEDAYWAAEVEAGRPSREEHFAAERVRWQAEFAEQQHARDLAANRKRTQTTATGEA